LSDFLKTNGDVAMPRSPAEAAIGQDDEGSDWQLHLERHAGTLPPEAGALKRVLERRDLQGITERFRSADTAALVAQRRYKRIGRLSLYAATVATVVGAIFIIPVETWIAGIPGSIASGVQMLALATAFLASRLLAMTSPFDAWMKKRADAEIARTDLFNTIARADEPVRDGELPLLPLKLEYFRRYHLDVQRRYYRGRGTQHKAAVWRNNRWLGVGMMFTLASVTLGFLAALHIAAAWELPVPAWMLGWTAGLAGQEGKRVILGLGTVASALYGLGTARSLMDLDERNASRFLTTSENLAFLTNTALPDARAAASAGRQEDVLAFMDRVNEQISSEHKEWTLLSMRDHGPDKLVHSRYK
jgi:hypothetical protein